ncbi:hypothetical protein [Salinisphaera hydrothermalis]|uniref:hypothetical protein n=1 Tax=Salinisphaera hydrothermalis TaxID=563188 RepID=UPI00334228FA
MDESMKKALEGLQGNAMKTAAEALKRSSAMTSPYQMPEFSMPRIPTQKEVNEYQSAGVLMQRLADSIVQWRRQLASDQQPAILALLHGGVQINVERLAEESFHGIRIEGKLNGSPCVTLTHQSTVQLLCYVEAVEQEEQRRSIGFLIDGKELNV